MIRPIARASEKAHSDALSIGQNQREHASSQGGIAMQYRVTALLGVAIAAAGVLTPVRGHAQDVNNAPNPYRATENWAQLPQGRVWGMAIGIDIDRDGKSVWVFDRCGAKTCTGSTVAPIQKFDASGKLLTSFGAGMFNFPHGLFVDRDDNVWVSDGKGADGKGHTVIKFSPDGKVLMTLGTPGVPGNDETHFNAPSDVLVAPNGDIFVADGHGEDTNARIVKFSKDGKYITAWGQKGSAPGEFNAPHGLAMDSAGRLFVADRANNRIQIFDQEGKFLAEWKQFGRPSGVFIDKNDMLYAADSQSGEKFNQPFQQGIRIGSVKDGKVVAFITDEGPVHNMPEGVAADAEGNVFGGFTDKQTVKKFVKTDRRAQQ
jgi:DNA-binding beta-propeller fold protein YncE